MTSSRPPVGASLVRDVVATLRTLDRDVNSARSLDDRRALVARLSDEPAVAPEAHSLQADLLLRTWPLRPKGSRLTPWRHLPLPGPSRLAWARLALRVDPSCCRELRDSEPALWQTALDGLDLLDAPDPRALLAALFELNDAAADRALQSALPEAVARGLLSPPDAHAMLLGRDDAWAWSTLAMPWACGLSLPPSALRRALRGDHAAAALQAAAARGLWSEIRFLLREPPVDADATPDWGLLRSVIEHAGRFGDGETIGELLAIALVEPAELGNEALRALVALHHQGHFVRESHAADALALLAAGAILPGDELAGLLFVARRAIVETLPRDPDDPLWLVLAPLLARWRLAPRPSAGLLEALLWLAREARRPALLDAALGLLRGLVVDLADLDPEPIETVALLRLDDAPVAALGLLEATAGEATRGELARRLGVEACEAPDEVLAPLASQALLVLWHATPLVEQRQLLDALGPVRMPEGLVRLLQANGFNEYAHATLELRRGADDPDELMLALCAVASPADLPRLELGLLRAIEKVAMRAPTPPGAHSGFQPSYEKWLGAYGPPPPYGEEGQQLARPVAEALDAIEARWKAQHRRPAWLLSKGPRLRAELLLRALESAPPRAALLVVLLQSLLELEHPRLPAVAVRLLAHPDDNVAKLAARLLARGGGAWLSLELARGAADEDDRRARACMQALAAAGGPAAEAAALGMLGRPTMNLKKAGADALSKLASPSSVPVLLRWLGQHDNPGLRAALGEALRVALGDGCLPALLAALAGAAGDEPRQRLLVKELDGLVDVRLARALLHQAPGWEHAFFEAVADRSLSLRGAGPSALATELRTLGLRAPDGPDALPPRPLFDDAVDDLARLGWGAERATAALDHWPERFAPGHVATLRRELHRWLDAMTIWRDVRPAALLDAVLAEGPDATELVWLREAAPALGALLGALPPGDRAALWSPLERLSDRLEPLDRLDLGAALRSVLGATPGLALSPLAALLRCGLVLRRDDVERALLGVADVPDPRAVRQAILADAFGVYGPAPDDASPDDEEARLCDLVDGVARDLDDTLPARLDAIEALRPVGVSTWSWPTEPVERRQRTSKPRPRGGHAALLDAIEAWLTHSPPGPTLSVERFAEALPTEVIALVCDASAADRLADFLGFRATPALRRAYRPWLEEQAEQAIGRATAALRAALEPPQRDTLWAAPSERESLRERWRVKLTTPLAELPAAPSEASEADRATWRREALGAAPEAARRALTRLSQAPDAEWSPLVLRATQHASARVRAHALRLIRRTLDRSTYLSATRAFLRDDNATVRRSAARAVGHGRDADALPDLVALLLDPVGWVRDEALSSLALYGEAGLAAIRHGMARARPDDARRLGRAESELRSRAGAR